jgi:hypothetical protein
MMFAAGAETSLGGNIVHKRNRFRFLGVGSDVQDLHALPFLDLLELHSGNARRFAFVAAFKSLFRMKSGVRIMSFQFHLRGSFSAVPGLSSHHKPSSLLTV